MKTSQVKKTTLYLDQDLLAEAIQVTGDNVTETVRQGLEAIVRKAAYQRMREFLGSERERPTKDVPRRREPARAPRPRVRKSA